MPLCPAEQVSAEGTGATRPDGGKSAQGFGPHHSNVDLRGLSSWGLACLNVGLVGLLVRRASFLPCAHQLLVAANRRQRS